MVVQSPIKTITSQNSNNKAPCFRGYAPPQSLSKTISKLDIAPIGKWYHQQRDNEETAETRAQTARVAILKNVLARYQNQMPGNARDKDIDCKKNNENTNTEFSFANLGNGRDIWSRIRPNQRNAQYNGRTPTMVTVVPSETPKKVKETEESITWSTGSVTKPSLFVRQTPKQSASQFRFSSLRKGSKRKPTDRNPGLVIPVSLTQGTSNNAPTCMVAFEPSVLNALPDLTPACMETNCLTNQPYERLRHISKAIEEKISLFEGTLEPGRNKSTITNGHSFKRMNDSSIHGKRELKVVFDTNDFPSSFERGFSMKGISSIINEFRNMETDAKLGLGDRLAGKGKMLLGSNYASSRTLVGARDCEVDSLSGKAKEMIIRGAECGLKEPKPLRLTEIRSIIGLCREQPGTPQLRRRAMLEPPGA